jgi:hypothetical protein
VRDEPPDRRVCEHRVLGDPRRRKAELARLDQRGVLRRDGRECRGLGEQERRVGRDKLGDEGPETGGLGPEDRTEGDLWGIRKNMRGKGGIGGTYIYNGVDSVRLVDVVEE